MTPGVLDHIRFQARQRPNALAVLGPAGPIVYQALLRDVDALATELLARGLTGADMVGLRFGINYLHLLAILALDRLGIPSMSFATAAVEPALAPRYGVTAIVAAEPASANPPCRWIELAPPDRSRLRPPDPARLAQIARPVDALVRVTWSSGTTGGPKGVPLTRAILAHRLVLRRLYHNLGPQTRYFAGMPLSASPCYLVSLATLAAGGTVVLPNPSMDFISWANTTGVTMTTASPAMLADLLERRGNPLRRLETVTCFNVVGANLPAQLVHEARALLTPNLWVSYGTSEVDGVATAPATLCLAEPSAAGFVSPWVEAEIVDVAYHWPTAGEGLLRLRGAAMVAGYYNDATATRRNFRDGWFYPGDLAEITSQGLLRIVGRIEDVIVRDGVAIAPGPIEAAIRALPQIRDVAVFPVAGADDVPLVWAAVVLAPGTDTAALRDAVATQLGGQAPARLLVIDRLPRNAAGKVVRRELVAVAQQSIRPADPRGPRPEDVLADPRDVRPEDMPTGPRIARPEDMP